MMSPRLPLARFARLGLACAAVFAAAWAGAAGLDFTNGLSPQEAASAGLAKLTAQEITALNRLVDRDVTLAHQGGVTGFSTEFTARHTGQERVSSGINRLTDGERLALDRYAARTIALGPPPTQGFVYSPPAAKPAAPPSDVDITPNKLEVHGDVSFTIGGASHGGSFYGTSMDATLTDPKHGFTLGVGFSEFRGKGLLGLCGPYGPYGPYAPGYDGPPYLDW